MLFTYLHVASVWVDVGQEWIRRKTKRLINVRRESVEGQTTRCEAVIDRSMLCPPSSKPPPTCINVFLRIK